VEHAADTLIRSSFLGLPVFRDLDALERMIRQDAVDTVLVALPWSAGEQMQMIIRRISMAPVDVYIYPGMSGFELPLRRADRALDVPLLMACTRPIGGWRAFIKRTEDIALSIGLLAFISPVMLTIAAAVKLTSKGPVFFRQRRLGYNNRVIEVLKFRSMYTHLSDADASLQAFRGDKRVTPVGAWLRKTSLDELPQLLNVLTGDMSLVGPRPHALSTTAGGLALEEAVPVYASRHRVKPGITGWAQVNGYRGALDSVEKIVQRVNHDLYYIENWSLGLDLKILWRTVRLVFADDNAF
jgi:Undecaprenyl-phosphate glucose phosphotransferase